uniref:uncharacterized protein LOC122601116 n=1 Tax=Erigeron canadensis TaxID=72917 RepID=UPI001CB902E7|nr:uncharacterized protein LOC122601116 [Erigeron canadensis]
MAKDNSNMDDERFLKNERKIKKEARFGALERDVEVLADGCDHCGDMHYSDEYPNRAPEDVNYVQNQSQGNFHHNTGFQIRPSGNRWQIDNYQNQPQQQTQHNQGSSSSSNVDPNAELREMMKHLGSNQAEKNTSIQMIRDDTKALSERLDQINGKVEINMKNQCVNFKDLESRMVAPARPTRTLLSNTKKNPRPQFSQGQNYTPPPGIPNYAKFIKELVTDRGKLEEAKANSLNVECFAILQNRILLKLEDPGSFLITCSIRTLTYKALADLWASINLMPYSVYTKLALGVLRPTRMSIRLVDHSFQYPIGIAENMTLRVGHIIFLVDFVILEMEEDTKVPLILGRPFLNTADVIIRVKDKEISLGMGTDRIVIDVIEDALDQEFQEFMETDIGEEEISNLGFGENTDEALFAEVMTLSSDESPSEDETFEEVAADGSSRVPNSVDVPLTDLELKPLPTHLEYAYLSGESSLPVVISSSLLSDEKDRLLSVLKAHKRAFAWKTTDIPGISPDFCQHKIDFLDDVNPVVQRHMRLNPNMKEVVKKEVIKLVDAGIVFPLPVVHRMLERCERAHLVLNWEKRHFMVTEGIVLGHKVSKAGIEVDRAKIDAIAKLPPPSNVKGVLKEKLTNSPIMVAPDWDLPFKSMCDANDYDVGAMLGQRVEKHFKSIYVSSKTLNPAQQNYTTTEKELLAVACPLDSFVQEFDIEIKDKKGAENLAANHLSHLEDPNREELCEGEINDHFPNESLMFISNSDEAPWFADIDNYLVAGEIPNDFTSQQKKKLILDFKHYFWENAYLFHVCAAGMVRRCVAGMATREILDACHYGPTRGHYGPSVTGKKVFDAGFHWPMIFKEAQTLVDTCDICQRQGNITKRDEMP